MPNNLYIEGPNGIGKTTLAMELESQGWHYRHHTVPKHPNRFLMRLGYYLREKFTSNCVYDRCWYSEWVYGKYYRHKSVLTPKDITKLCVYAIKNNSHVIIFLPEDMMMCRQMANEVVGRFEEHPYAPLRDELFEISQEYKHIAEYEFIVNKLYVSKGQYATNVYFNEIDKLKEMWNGRT